MSGKASMTISPKLYQDLLLVRQSDSESSMYKMGVSPPKHPANCGQANPPAAVHEGQGDYTQSERPIGMRPCQQKITMINRQSTNAKPHPVSLGRL